MEGENTDFTVPQYPFEQCVIFPYKKDNFSVFSSHEMLNACFRNR
jgi:hypothetical protein